MHGQTSTTNKIFASHLRKTMTDAERKLWRHLRGEQLGAKFRRQHPFQGYVLDFVCFERGLVIEVDGSQHADAAVKDAVRTDVLERAGFRVLRFWNNEVLTQTDAVLACIAKALNPSPS
ncbi:MAG: endonuclease domain-containing protein [Rhodocyclales bacterium]|nr:endonuclease domain-containing protein [Rhodocyclales bacterium]